MAARAWGRLHGCKAVSGSSCSSPSLWPQPPHLPGYRCVEVAWVGIHACTARALSELHHVIQCRSHSLQPAKANYATIELECLAIQWVVEKCQYFLRGCGNFLIQTNHRPLIGVFQKQLREVANPQIFRFQEKLLLYSFDVSWLPGKKNLIADALSRNPCDVDHNGKKKVPNNCASDTGIGVKAMVTGYGHRPYSQCSSVLRGISSCQPSLQQRMMMMMMKKKKCYDLNQTKNERRKEGNLVYRRTTHSTCWISQSF